MKSPLTVSFNPLLPLHVTRMDVYCRRHEMDTITWS